MLLQVLCSVLCGVGAVLQRVLRAFLEGLDLRHALAVTNGLAVYLAVVIVYGNIIAGPFDLGDLSVGLVHALGCIGGEFFNLSVLVEAVVTVDRRAARVASSVSEEVFVAAHAQGTEGAGKLGLALLYV